MKLNSIIAPLVCLSSLLNLKVTNAVLCSDDVDFRYNGAKHKTCKWVSKKLHVDKRCQLDGVGDACSLSCGTCEYVDDPEFLFFPRSFYSRASGENCASFLGNNKEKKCKIKIIIGGVKSQVKDHCRVTCGEYGPPTEVPSISPSESHCVNDTKIIAKKFDDSGQIVEDRQKFFGWSTAIVSNSIAVGAYAHGTFFSSYKGAVYLYQKKNFNKTWELEAKLEASDGVDGDYFGTGVAMSADILVAGARRSDNFKGSAYVFSRDARGTMMESKKLFASDGEEGDHFGATVRVSKNLILIQNSKVIDFTDSELYFFEQNKKKVWKEVKKVLKVWAFDTSEGLVVTATYNVLTIYSRSISKEWETTQEIITGLTNPSSISVSEDTIAMGIVNNERNAEGVLMGAVHVFTKEVGGTWVKTQKLLSSNDGKIWDFFGKSVAITGNVLVVGATFDDNDQGAAYLFSREEGRDWVETKKVVAEDGANRDYFGYSVSASGTTAVIGALRNDNRGSVYAIDLNC